MYHTKSKDFEIDMKDISTRIREWIFNDKETFLNIVSVPYNKSFIFLEGIVSFAKKQKRILYITNEKPGEISIINYIKRYTEFKSYSYIKPKGEEGKANLIICSPNTSFNIKGEFDLLIYDDISCFPNYSKKDIQRLIFHRPRTKTITYSIEPIFDNVSTIEIPTRSRNLPIAEPRVINTRIDIDKDIPYVLYQYLKYFIESRKKLIIYTPESEKCQKVYNYMKGIESKLGCSIVNYREHKKRVESLLRVKELPLIIVAEKAEDINCNSENLNVIIYFAEDSCYDYKTLVYFCGKVVRNLYYNAGEIVFLCNEESENMEKTKAITRNFNKIAWERGLLNI